VKTIKAQTVDLVFVGIGFSVLTLIGCKSPGLVGGKNHTFYLKGSWGSVQERTHAELLEMREVKSASSLSAPGSDARIQIDLSSGVTSEFPCKVNCRFIDNLMSYDSQGKIIPIGSASECNWEAFVLMNHPITSYRILVSGKVSVSQTFKSGVEKVSPPPPA